MSGDNDKQGKAPEWVATPRLNLRRPRREDAAAIFARYAGDAEVTRYLGWPRHESVDDTHVFLETSDAQWAQWPAGPYLLESRIDGRLLGSAGLHFETRHRAMTGYVLARDAGGKGFATEALLAIVAIARGLDLVRLYALCHVDHAASQRVLEKGGFAREGILRKHTRFPNLDAGEPCDMACYARVRPHI